MLLSLSLLVPSSDLLLDLNHDTADQHKDIKPDVELDEIDEVVGEI